MKFKSRNDIKQKREELREKLLKNFKEMCEKKLNVLHIRGVQCAGGRDK